MTRNVDCGITMVTTMNRGVYLVVQCIILVWSVEQDGPSSTLICHHNLLVVPRGCLICTASLSSNQLLHHLTVLLGSSRLVMDEDEMEEGGRGGNIKTEEYACMTAHVYTNSSTVTCTYKCHNYTPHFLASCLYHFCVAFIYKINDSTCM